MGLQNLITINGAAMEQGILTADLFPCCHTLQWAQVKEAEDSTEAQTKNGKYQQSEAVSVKIRNEIDSPIASIGK